MSEPTTTLTAVKTKTVTRTQMAVALACLGASIIAAAAMSIAATPSNICLSNTKIKVALTLGQGVLVSSCKGQLIVPTPKFSQLLVRNYTDDVLTLIVDKKIVTFKVGDDYKTVGKPMGDVVGYQQNLYVAYSGKIDKKADINLFYGYPAGEKGTFCSDNDESQQNYDGSSIKDFKFFNPYVKGTVSYYDEGIDEMLPVEDTCGTYDYGYNDSLAAPITSYLYEAYCSTADGGKYLGSTIICEGGCVDGACVPVVASSTPPAVEPVTPSSTPSDTQQVGTMNLVSGGKLATNKLKEGENEVAKLSFSVTNEDVVINQLIFNFDWAGNAKPEQIQDFVLKDSKGNIVGGPKPIQQYGAKYQLVLQNSPKGLFTLSSATNESQNFSLYATVNDPTLLYDSTGGFRLNIDPTKDVVAVGVKTLSAIQSTNKKSLSWQTMYGSTQPMLTFTSSSPYVSPKLFVPGSTVGLIDISLFNSSTEDIDVKSIQFTQSIANAEYSSPNNLLNLWIEDEAGKVVSEENVPFNVTPVIQMKSSGLTVPSNQVKVVKLKGVIAPLAPFGNAVSGQKIGYHIKQAQDIKAKLSNSGSDVKVESKKGIGGGAFNALYVFKAYPKITKKDVYTNKLANGTRDLFKFDVVAVGDDISLYRFDFYIETSMAKLSNLYLFDVTNGQNELLMNATPGKTVDNIWSTKGNDWTTNFDAGEVVVSKSQPRTFVLRGNVSGATTGAAISTKLVGPKMAESFYTGPTYSSLGTVASVDFYFSSYNNIIVWSDRSATSHSFSSNDWTNAAYPILSKGGGNFETLAY